jgi:hypothetical protein
MITYSNYLWIKIIILKFNYKISFYQQKNDFQNLEKSPFKYYISLFIIVKWYKWVQL